jgi:hypothetical protein
LSYLTAAGGDWFHKEATMDPAPFHTYIVHMKHITASQARREWFRILDEVADGETVVIDRKGRRIQIRRVEAPGACAPLPDYTEVLRVREDATEAHRWGWEWPGEEGGALRPREDGGS